MKYYVNEGHKIGKTYDAKDDSEAIAYATGYGYGKDWRTVNVYCQTTREMVTRDFPTMHPNWNERPAFTRG